MLAALKYTFSLAYEPFHKQTTLATAKTASDGGQISSQIRPFRSTEFARRPIIGSGPVRARAMHDPIPMETIGNFPPASCTFALEIAVHDETSFLSACGLSLTGE
jgi:hypothetical protein